MCSSRHVLSLLIALGIAACSTPYQATFLSGGYSEKQLEADVWRVEFDGNGFTTQETVQTYWLYRSAQLTLDKGYDGFEIVSSTSLVLSEPPSIQIAAAAGGGAHYTYHPVYIPTYTGGDSGPKYTVIGDIRLLKAPIQAKPPKMFDAAQLKSTLDPYVNGKKCDMGNVCAHVHRYLIPETETASANSTTVATLTTGPSPTLTAHASVTLAQPAPAVAMKPPAQLAEPFPSVVEFHCPAAGTVIRKSTGGQITFAEADGLRCAYTDEAGQKHQRYALFTDADGPLARKELDPLWPLKQGNTVSFTVIEAYPLINRMTLPNHEEVFAVTRQERITVPAGTFDTYVVEWREQATGTSRTSALITQWYAPGIGCVVKSSVQMLTTDESDPYGAMRYVGMTYDATEIALPNGQPLPAAVPPLPAPTATSVGAPAPARTSASPADRLIALKRLLDEKLITRQEYDERRKAILDGL